MSWFLIWGEGRGVPRGQPEGWLRWFAHPLGGAVFRGQAQYPAFAPGSTEVPGGFLVFLYLVYNLPQLHMYAVFVLFFKFIYFSLFIFVCIGSSLLCTGFL